MAYQNVRFPTDISYGSVGGPGFKTSIVTSVTGREQRNGEWATARGQYDVRYGIKTDAEIAQVIKFFYARNAMLYSFRYKDWTDYFVEEQNMLVFASGTSTYQFFKRYSDDGGTYDRTLTKLVDGSLEGIKVNGVASDLATIDATIDYDTGIMTIGGSTTLTDGDIVSVDYIEFDVLCRFDIDYLPVTVEEWQQNTVSSIPLVEVPPDEEAA